MVPDELIIAALASLHEAARVMSDPEHCFYENREHIPWKKLAEQAKAALEAAETAKKIPADRLRLIADMFDKAFPDDSNPEIQRDLREWADALTA